MQKKNMMGTVIIEETHLQIYLLLCDIPQNFNQVINEAKWSQEDKRYAILVSYLIIS